MKNIIISAAHFLLCSSCERHGQIVTATGEHGAHSVTKRQARKTLFAFVEAGKISPDEIGEAERQLDDSTLPSASDELEAYAIDIVNGLHGFYDPDEDATPIPGEETPAQIRLQ